MISIGIIAPDADVHAGSMRVCEELGLAGCAEIREATLDVSLHQALLISQGSWMVFLREPISAVLLSLAGLSLLSGTPVVAFISGRIKRLFAGKR
jgi:hypothetical protein